MKVCSPPEFFNKNMSHEQSLFMWSTFRDSSMGTKLKYFWRTHETVQSAWIFSPKKCLTNNYLSCDPHYVILAWVQSWNIFEKLMKVCSPPEFFHEMWITWKVIVRETCFCEKILADYTVSWVFQIYFNFVPMLESRNVDHVKSNCSWDMLLWKNSGGRHTFISLSKIFQLCTHARITKCGSREK